MSGVQNMTVKPDEDGMRLDRWFKVHFPGVRHGELEKYLRKGQVRVARGRVKASRPLVIGEEIRIPPLQDDATRAAPKRPSTISRKDAAAFIKNITIFEDDHILAINKPFGLAVQGGTKTREHVDGFLEALSHDNDRPRLVHRLDRDTGGLLLLAKTRRAAQRLGDAFQGHKVEKDYWALVVGAPRPREGTIDMPVAKRMVRMREQVVPAEGEGAKKAISDYQILDEAGDRLALLALRPITGRTHQLRVHCAAIECPVVGDGKYGGAEAHVEGMAGKLHLFCRAMSFPHPGTGRMMELKAPLTAHMREVFSFFNFDEDVVYSWPDDLR